LNPPFVGIKGDQRIVDPLSEGYGGFLFFVRVMMFFMSRRADDASRAQAGNAASQVTSHRTHTGTFSRSGTPQQGRTPTSAITREEMTRLFGTALRVR